MRVIETDGYVHFVADSASINQLLFGGNPAPPLAAFIGWLTKDLHPTYRRYIELHTALNNLPKTIAVLHADGGYVDSQWTYNDDGRDIPVQNWIDEYDGQYGVLFVCLSVPLICNEKTKSSLLMYAPDNTEMEVIWKDSDNPDLFNELVIAHPQSGELDLEAAQFDLKGLEEELTRKPVPTETEDTPDDFLERLIGLLSTVKDWPHDGSDFFGAYIISQGLAVVYPEHTHFQIYYDTKQFKVSTSNRAAYIDLDVVAGGESSKPINWIGQEVLCSAAILNEGREETHVPLEEIVELLPRLLQRLSGRDWTVAVVNIDHAFIEAGYRRLIA